MAGATVDRVRLARLGVFQVLLVVACWNAGSTSTTSMAPESSPAEQGVTSVPTSPALSLADDALLSEPLGRPDCQPPSPYAGWASGLAEVRATSTGIEVWGLMWHTPPFPVGEEVKMVWRVTGSGEFGIRAVSGAEKAELTMGPVVHQDSSFDRPGEEWGTAFIFPVPGCWDVELRRGPHFAHVWVEVAASDSAVGAVDRTELKLGAGQLQDSFEFEAEDPISHAFSVEIEMPLTPRSR